MPRSLSALAVVWSPAAVPQTITGTPQGTVTDTTDGVAPSAVVMAINTTANAEFVTGSIAAGRCVAPLIQPGPFVNRPDRNL